jgi:hypothetical protein
MGYCVFAQGSKPSWNDNCKEAKMNSGLLSTRSNIKPWDCQQAVNDLGDRIMKS